MLNLCYPTVLCLDDGTLYRGWSFFKNCMACGEIVFNTGMTGYQEIFTDPSYSGQILIFTYPELGNTGLNIEDSESSYIHIKGIIARNICLYPSNWRSEVSLKNYIVQKQIPHIFGLDTRSLTKHIRLKGTMLGYISNNYVDSNYFSLYSKNLQLDLVKRVTSLKSYYINSKSRYIFSETNYLNYKIKNFKKKHLNVVVINFGVKSNILYRLIAYGCSVCILPATVNYKVISDYKPNGILLSNGPGDPSVLLNSIDTIRKLVYFADIPIFGICMGHQLLNLSLGFSTFKLKFGHRGLNHPSGTNKYSEITSQNHGFAVKLQDVEKISLEDENLATNQYFDVTHLNLNDLTLGGVIHYSKPIFSVQHHPEASPGPHDSDYLFQFFINLMYSFQTINH